MAVTMVIASHALPVLPELPWTVKRFSNLCFYGVQLFFVVSAFTLANSWRRSEIAGRPSLVAFALRRLFRIAPAYFLAALFYSTWAPAGTVNLSRVLTLMTFTNGWSPGQMSTVPGTWSGVPGGWSIEAEFAFYALFPLLVSVLRGPVATFAALLVSLLLAWAANRVGSVVYQPLYGLTATDQFLYYWIPKQLPVFLCGLLCYEVVTASASSVQVRLRGRYLPGLANVALIASAAVVLMVAFVPWPRLAEPGHAFVASHVVAAVAFFTMLAALLLHPSKWIVNPVFVQLGQASFSAYLIHFAVIEALTTSLPASTFALTREPAAAVALLIFVAVLAITGMASRLTFRLIELPGMRLGATLIDMIGDDARRTPHDPRAGQHGT